MSTDIQEARDRLGLACRDDRPARLRRSCGLIVSAVVGPATAVFAVEVLHMQLIEGAALLFLISAWIGPLLMSRGDA